MTFSTNVTKAQRNAIDCYPYSDKPDGEFRYISMASRHHHARPGYMPSPNHPQPTAKPEAYRPRLASTITGQLTKEELKSFAAPAVTKRGKAPSLQVRPTTKRGNRSGATPKVTP